MNSNKYPGVYKADSGDNRYVLRICVTVNGQTHRDTRTVTAGSPKKAYEQLVKIKEDLRCKYETGKLAKYDEMRFEELVELWNNTVKVKVGQDGGLSYTCYNTYISILKKYIIPYFTGVSIHNINKGSLNFYRDYIRSEYELSEKTISNQLMLMRTICTFALDRDLIAVSWFDGFKNTKIEDPDIEYFTEQQVRNMLKLLKDEVEQVKEMNSNSIRYNKLSDDERYKKENNRILQVMEKLVFVSIAAYTGARRGEICALDWGNVYFASIGDTSYIEFKGSCYREKGKGSVKKNTLKNGSKSKTVFIDTELVDLLKQYRTQQNLCIKLNGWKNKGYMFINKNGLRANGDCYTQWFSDWVVRNKDEIGMDDEQAAKAHLHCFRHSFITSLLSNGADLKTVADLAGHRDSGVSLKRYCGIVEDNKKKAAMQLSSIYGSSEVRN